MQPIKWYNLTKWDKVRHGDEILTFHRMDWAVAQMRDSEWFTQLHKWWEYELWEDWIYFATNQD